MALETTTEKIWMCQKHQRDRAGKSLEAESVRQRGINEFLIPHCMASLCLPIPQCLSAFSLSCFPPLFLLFPKRHAGGKRPLVSMETNRLSNEVNWHKRMERNGEIKRRKRWVYGEVISFCNLVSLSWFSFICGKHHFPHKMFCLIKKASIQNDCALKQRRDI